MDYEYYYTSISLLLRVRVDTVTASLSQLYYAGYKFKVDSNYFALCTTHVLGCALIGTRLILTLPPNDIRRKSDGVHAVPFNGTSIPLVI